VILSIAFGWWIAPGARTWISSALTKFRFVGRAAKDSYSPMKRLLLAVTLCIGSLCFLTNCATNDSDPFQTHSSPDSSPDDTVPGAGATPPPQSSSAGWQW
jgi:hypothetical protein